MTGDGKRKESLTRKGKLEKEQKELLEKQKQFAIQETSKLKAALDYPAARYYLVKQIYYSGLFSDTFHPDPNKASYNQGQRLLAIRTLREASLIDRKYVEQLVGDTFEYEKKLRRKGLV